jgi:hypothetical protein
MSRDKAPNLRKIQICRCCGTCDAYDPDYFLCGVYDFFLNKTLNEDDETVCDDWR